MAITVSLSDGLIEMVLPAFRDALQVSASIFLKSPEWRNSQGALVCWGDQEEKRTYAHHQIGLLSSAQSDIAEEVIEKAAAWMWDRPEALSSWGSDPFYISYAAAVRYRGILLFLGGPHRVAGLCILLDGIRRMGMIPNFPHPWLVEGCMEDLDAIADSAGDIREFWDILNKTE